MSEARKTPIFPASIVTITDNYTVVINKGSQHGIKQGQRFLIYSLSENDLLDPITGENLGRLEIVKGTGRVIHVQELIATLESDMEGRPDRTIVRRKAAGFLTLGGDTEEETIQPKGPRPFAQPMVGDKAKPV